MDEYRDPLDEVLKKHKDAIEGKPIEEEEDVVDWETPEVAEEEPSEEEEDIYGDNDATRDIEAEEAEERAIIEEYRQKKEAEKKSAKKVIMPAQSLDPAFMNEATSFQADKIELVNLMVQRVLAERNIFDGYFPSDKRMHIMGDLIEEYHYCENNEPSEKFKHIVFENWISEKQLTENINSKKVEERPDETNKEEQKEEAPANPVINITNSGDAPVTVNVDDSIIPNISETRKVDINIVTVTNKDSEIRTVVENAEIEGLLTEQHVDINNVPVTLIRSAYRAVLRPMNWFDYLKTAAPKSGNPTDALMQRWTNIYEHIISTSVGMFESLDDFLDKTKWEDMELFEWALFVATSCDTEMISYTCNNKIGTKLVEKRDKDGDIIYGADSKPVMVEEDVLCKHKVNHEYDPRSIIKLDEKFLPKYYTDVHEAAVGEDAEKLWKEVIGTKQQLTLPDSKYIIEISHASAKEYITKKIPTIFQLCKDYNIPFNDYEKQMMRHPVASLYLMCSLFIDKIIIRKNEVDYEFSDWEKIRKIVDTLTNDDIQVIMYVFEKRYEETPVSFQFSNLECPSCHDVIESLPVDDLFELMGFNLSRRLQNTEVNLIDIVTN